jgi:propanol-preferring alcohol dehydrogenase
MKSARITAPSEPLKISESETPKPQGTQVLVKVKSVGVCHSDLHLWEGGYDLGDGEFMKVTDRGVKYPVTPGHEIVGTVEEIGDAVSDVSKGDDILVFPWIGCGECPACKVGNENLCDAPRSMGVFQDGGYSDYATAIKKANENSPEFIVIVGAGGLGLMGVQIANAITNAKIICVDLDDAKLDTAKEMGADYTVNSKDPETSQKIMSICNGKGADSVVDFVNAPPTAKLDFAILRKRGNLVLVGLFGGSIELSLVTIPLKSIIIQGAYTGNYNDMVELLALARKGTINPVISKRYSLDESNTALEDLKARKIIGRAVINP